MTDHEQQARLKKAFALATHLTDSDPNEVLRLHPEDWIRISEEAGVNSPSTLTVQIVASLLENVDSDPFDFSTVGSARRAAKPVDAQSPDAGRKTLTKPLRDEAIVHPGTGSATGAVVSPPASVAHSRDFDRLAFSLFLRGVVCPEWWRRYAGATA